MRHTQPHTLVFSAGKKLPFHTEYEQKFVFICAKGEYGMSNFANVDTFSGGLHVPIRATIYFCLDTLSYLFRVCPLLHSPTHPISLCAHFRRRLITSIFTLDSNARVFLAAFPSTVLPCIPVYISDTNTLISLRISWARNHIHVVCMKSCLKRNLPTAHAYGNHMSAYLLRSFIITFVVLVLDGGCDSNLSGNSRRNEIINVCVTN